ncbi:hypothetical protein EOD42_22200 [Rhodovarius crocodyli]|uniref:Uncharacterized protein n=1 Tax=Rhodovarius crocodyli TaxID=1979269 RepID=A0A437M0X7_9PROT|nr:hypothetical protein [Rhodovarius crocodyli]RVT91369.1 hypothetical protein EOD42_22200 [Rhodovarius crocodyli]
MADHSINMSPDEVMALLDGRKTMVRAIIRIMPRVRAKVGSGNLSSWEHTSLGGVGVFRIVRGERVEVPSLVGIHHPKTATCILAPFQQRDRLWVREPWAVHHSFDGTDAKRLPATPVNYLAGSPELIEAQVRRPDRMPRWASRLTLHVESVRCERLHDTTLGEICAEGLARSIYDFKPVTAGLAAWKAHCIERLGAATWEENPWVAAARVRLVKRNIDAPAPATAPVEADHG